MASWWEEAWSALDRHAESQRGPLGSALGWLSESTGQTRRLVYVGVLVSLVGVVASASVGTGAALTLLVTLPYPVVQSLSVAEMGAVETQGEWLLYWCVWGLLCTVPVPVLRLLAALWLQHPVSAGARLLYHSFLRPFLLLQHRLVHTSAWAQLHPTLWRFLRLNPQAVHALLARADPAAVLRKPLDDAAAALGLTTSLTLPSDPKDPRPPASFILDAPEYSLISSVFLSALRNAAALNEPQHAN